MLKIEIPGIESEKALLLYGGNQKIFISIMRTYVKGMPALLEKLRSVKAEAFNEARITAHGIKGSSGNAGAYEIMKKAAELEMSAKINDIEGFLSLREPFISDVETLLKNIKVWLDAFDTGNAKPLLERPDPALLSKLRQSCETYNMTGIDEAMDELDGKNYNNGNELIEWLKEKLNTSELNEVITRLEKENY